MLFFQREIKKTLESITKYTSLARLKLWSTYPESGQKLCLIFNAFCTSQDYFEHSANQATCKLILYKQHCYCLLITSIENFLHLVTISFQNIQTQQLLITYHHPLSVYRRSTADSHTSQPFVLLCLLCHLCIGGHIDNDQQP